MKKQRMRAWGDGKVIQIAATLVLNQSGQLLLLQRHTENLGGGMWGIPGGKLDEGESAEAAALRELYEETGIIVHKMTPLGAHTVHMPHGAVHMTTYQVVAPDDADVVINPDEHHAHRWFDMPDLLDTQGLLWGVPTILRDFGLIDDFGADPTLADGSKVILLERYPSSPTAKS